MSICLSSFLAYYDPPSLKLFDLSSSDFFCLIAANTILES